MSHISPKTARVLASLATARSWAELTDGSRSDGLDIAELIDQLQALLRTGLIDVRLMWNGRRAATVHANGPLANFTPQEKLPLGSSMVLSRFVLITREGTSIVADCPHTSISVTLQQPALLGEIAAGVVDASKNEMAWLMRACGLLTVLDDNGLEDSERTNPVLRQREPHDVLMHSRSRRGLTRGPTGATYPYYGRFAAPPAIRVGEPSRQRTIRLPESRAVADTPSASLIEVMAHRHSIREHGSRPITREQIGEFLHRVARVDRVIPADPNTNTKYETSVRPYPSGGAMYDLELYLTIQSCSGIPPGMYRYLPVPHALEDIQAPAQYQQELLADACAAAGAGAPPQVLITLSSRFDRLTWKYRGMTYATTLKNVGVLYAMMYLVATAMDLAPCALGGGDSATFSLASALPVLSESSVGEFILGTRAHAIDMPCP